MKLIFEADRQAMKGTNGLSRFAIIDVQLISTMQSLLEEDLVEIVVLCSYQILLHT